MPKIHRIKFKGVQLCDAVYSGEKPYEIRKNDRDYRVGDMIEPVTIDDNMLPINHPLSGKRYVITYVSKDWPKAITPDYCIFGIREIR